MDQHEQIILLLEKIEQAKASPVEAQELIDLVNEQISPELVQSIQDFYEGNTPDVFPADFTSAEHWKPVLHKVLAIDKSAEVSQAATIHRIHFFKTAWFRYAAVLLLVAGAATFLYRANRRPSAGIVQTISSKSAVLPGSDKAVLTLAGGEKIELDAKANAYLAQQGITNSRSALNYTNSTGTATMNTLTTPRGGQYKLQLSDGTNVWLNAASSITYPTSFASAKERSVTVNGEAYFEVAANKSVPFLVKTGNTVIQVLGTSFNVNAYADEAAVKITLAEGAVKIGEELLKPGQAYSNGKVAATNMEQDLAWKNGLFNFDESDLHTVMRQLERWYDIKVEYRGESSELVFKGKMYRNVNLEDVLEVLQKMGVRFKLDGKTLIVL